VAHPPPPSAAQTTRRRRRYGSLLTRERGASVVTQECRTPMHAAAYVGRELLCAMLHHHGGDVGALTEREWTPLHFAAWGGHTKTALMLGVLGAPLDARSQDGYSAADCARMRGFSELAATLTLHRRKAAEPTAEPASPSCAPSERADRSSSI